MNTLFHLTDLRAGYKGKPVLNLPELIIRSKRVSVLTGPNGCGKSTLLNVLGFLIQPQCGSIRFAGQPVQWTRAELKSLRQRVTLMHQSPFLFAGTVAQNVAYGLILRGVRGERLRRCMSDSLALVSLGGFDERDVRQLSAGESRRVALARALAVNPEVLLLDEPLANLDQHSIAVVERVIAALPELGTTVVMATHDLNITQIFNCDVIRLNDGRLEQPSRIEACPPLMMPAY